MSFSAATVVGRFGRDPELRVTNSGTDVVNFSLAIDSGWGDNKRTSWVNCVAFKQRAAFIGQHFRKGDEILIHGELEEDSWTSKDGDKRSKLQVLVQHAEFTNGRKGETRAAEHEQDAGDPEPFVDSKAGGEPEDVPF